MSPLRDAPSNQTDRVGRDGVFGNPAAALNLNFVPGFSKKNGVNDSGSLTEEIHPKKEKGASSSPVTKEDSPLLAGKDFSLGGVSREKVDQEVQRLGLDAKTPGHYFQEMSGDEVVQQGIRLYLELTGHQPALREKGILFLQVHPYSAWRAFWNYNKSLKIKKDVFEHIQSFLPDIDPIVEEKDEAFAKVIYLRPDAGPWDVLHELSAILDNTAHWQNVILASRYLPLTVRRIFYKNIKGKYSHPRDFALSGLKSLVAFSSRIFSAMIIFLSATALILMVPTIVKGEVVASEISVANELTYPLSATENQKIQRQQAFLREIISYMGITNKDVYAFWANIYMETSSKTVKGQGISKLKKEIAAMMWVTIVRAQTRGTSIRHEILKTRDYSWTLPGITYSDRSTLKMKDPLASDKFMDFWKSNKILSNIQKKRVIEEVVASVLNGEIDPLIDRKTGLPATHWQTPDSPKRDPKKVHMIRQEGSHDFMTDIEMFHPWVLRGKLKKIFGDFHLTPTIYAAGRPLINFPFRTEGMAGLQLFNGSHPDIFKHISGDDGKLPRLGVGCRGCAAGNL